MNGFFIYYSDERNAQRLLYRLQSVFPLLLAGLILLNFNSALFTSDEQADVKSELIIEQIDNRLVISGSVTNLGEHSETLHYQLELERKGASGMTKSSQSGRLSIDAGESAGVSTSRVNTGKGDTCRISLIVKDTEEEVVSTSNLVFKIS